jgi:hypothetical protein
MSNLKKVLALTLALAMVMGFSISANAVSVSDFSDAGEIRPGYEIAVDLLTELTVINGMPDGTFAPGGLLTRAQYAKMLYVIHSHGNDDGAILFAGLPHNFGDVPNGAWYDGYISWMYGKNWVSGRNAEGTVFGPDDSVTGFEALKMSLVALGYDEDIEGFTGDQWKSAVMNRAQDAGLLNGIDSRDLMDESIRRDVAAHILHNTLFAPNVQYIYNATGTIQQVSRIVGTDNKYVTLAKTYLSLSVLTGVAIANSWANIEPVNKPAGTNSAVLVRTVDGDALQTPETMYFPEDIDLDLLGYDVRLYAHTKVFPTTGVNGQWDYIYGTPEDSGRNNVGKTSGSNTANTPVDYADDPNGLNNAGKANGLYDDNTAPGNTAADSILNAADTFPGAFIDYKAWAYDSVIGKDSPINFIDNNGDGNYEYVIARNLNYAKVTNVSSDDDAKVIALRGNGGGGAFDAGRALNNKEKSAIYGGADLKVDDRVLVYGIGDKFGVDVVKPFTGTLTQSRDGGSIALIGDTEYKASALGSRVSNLADVLDGGNFNVEKTYYADADKRILEGPGSAPDTSVWAMVLDSAGYDVMNDKSGTQVKLLLQDGSTFVGNLTGVADSAGNAYDWTGSGGGDITLGVGNSLTWAADTDTETNTLSMAFDGVRGQIFKATVSEDGKSVSLKNPGVDYGVTGSGAGANYTKGNSTFTGLAALGDSRIVNGSVIFVYNTGSNNAAVYIGRSMESFNGAVGGGAASFLNIIHDSNVDQDVPSTIKPITAMSLVGTNLPITKKYDGKWGYILSVDEIRKNEAGNFWASMTIFDGEKVDKYTVADKIRIKNTVNNVATAWNDGLINSPADDLNGNNFGVPTGSGGIPIEFVTNAEGKITSIATLQIYDGDPLTFSPSTPAIPGNGGVAFLGYATYNSSGFTNLWGIDNTADNYQTISFTSDAKFWNIYGNDAVAASGVEGYANGEAIQTMILVGDDGLGHTVYMFPEKTTKTMTQIIAQAAATATTIGELDDAWELLLASTTFGGSGELETGKWVGLSSGIGNGTNGTWAVTNAAFDGVTAAVSTLNEALATAEVSGTTLTLKLAALAADTSFEDDVAGVTLTKDGVSKDYSVQVNTLAKDKASLDTTREAADVVFAVTAGNDSDTDSPAAIVTSGDPWTAEIDVAVRTGANTITFTGAKSVTLATGGSAVAITDTTTGDNVLNIGTGGVADQTATATVTYTLAGASRTITVTMKFVTAT